MRTISNGTTRIIAFDVRPHRLGYVVFEDSIQLIDWNVSRSDNPMRLANHVERLLSTFEPSAVVLRRVEAGGWRDRPSLRRLMGRIRERIRTADIPVVYISGAAIRQVFGKCGEPTKDRVAGFIAAKFPELAPQLPPRRMPWEPEHWRMPLFDASALALTYFVADIDVSVKQKILRDQSASAGPSGA